MSFPFRFIAILHQSRNFCVRDRGCAQPVRIQGYPTKVGPNGGEPDLTLTLNWLCG